MLWLWWCTRFKIDLCIGVVRCENKSGKHRHIRFNIFIFLSILKCCSPYWIQIKSSNNSFNVYLIKMIFLMRLRCCCSLVEVHFCTSDSFFFLLLHLKVAFFFWNCFLFFVSLYFSVYLYRKQNRKEWNEKEEKKKWSCSKFSSRVVHTTIVHCSWFNIKKNVCDAKT